MSNMEEALRQLAGVMTGQPAESVPENLEEICTFIAENYSTGEAPAAPTVDSLGGATDTGKALMKAADADAARKAIGAGTSNFSGNYDDLKSKPSIPGAYTLPAATDKALGGVKKAAAVTFTAEGATAETCATAIAAIIANLKAAGSMV